MLNTKRKLKNALQKQRSLQEAFGACQAKLAAKGIFVDSADQLPEVIDALIEMAETGTSSMLEGQPDGPHAAVTAEEDDLGFSDSAPTTGAGSVEVPRPVIGRDTVPRVQDPGSQNAQARVTTPDGGEDMDPSSIAAKFAKRNADMLDKANKGQIKQGGGKPGARLGAGLGSMPSAPKMDLDAQRAALQRIGVNAQAQPVGGIKQ
jgi:hypothetical protein